MTLRPELYDTHCHLDFTEFEGMIEPLLASCRRQNITKIIIPSVSKESWKRVETLAVSEKELFYALGLHPLYIERHSQSDIEELIDLVSSRPPGLVALGEIGLDAEVANAEFQEELFVKQLSVAQEYCLPVIIHARRTHSQILSALKDVRVSGVIHAFSGSKELLRQYLSKGISIGVGCVITWPGATKTRDAIANAPIDSLLLETDSPDMRVYSARDERFGCPLSVSEVFAALCEIRRETPDVLAEALRDNANKLFFN